MREEVAPAVEALRAGELVVYPTETVYGLGADATDATAVERVFEAKRRDRKAPISAAFPSVDAAFEHTTPTADERSFMRAFLPGPVTVLVERKPSLPDVLTAGDARVGVRVPDLELARELLGEVAPVTATSANVSGGPNARTVAQVDDRIREAAAVVLDGGETPGGESTVVDIARGEVVRAGRMAGAIEAWLDAH
jgi:L-threonylcarbamoyladenylate synthase